MKNKETKMTVAFGVYAVLSQFGASPADAEAGASFVEQLMTQVSSGNPIVLIVLGAVASLYTYSRTKRKNVKDTLEAKLKMMEMRNGNPQGKHN